MIYAQAKLIMCSRLAILSALLLLSLVPLTSQAQVTDTDAINQVSDNLSAGLDNVVPSGFSNDGIYGCTGGGYGSVGLAHARGIFVPVSEEAVAQNTHTLLYKECILDAITLRAKEATVAAITKSTFQRINQGPDGKPQFIDSIEEDIQEVEDKVVEKFLKGKRTEVIFEPFRQEIRQSLYTDYQLATHKPEDVYKSTVPEDKREEYLQYTEGAGKFSWNMFMIATQPQNNLLGIKALALNQMLSDKDKAVNNRYTELGWYDGFKPQKDCKQIPTGNGRYEEQCYTTTPGSVIASLTNYTAQTGLRMTENADEIDELVGSLMSNIHTQILTSVGGLRGITQQSNGSPSYVDRIVSDAAARARGAYTSAGSGILDGALATELSYSVARKAAKESLELTVAQIKDKELSCWDNLIAQAKADITNESEEEACVKAGSGTDNDPIRDEDGNCLLTGSAAVQESQPIRTHPQGVSEDSPLDVISTEITITAKTRNETVTYTLIKHNKNSLATIARQITPLLNIVDKSITSSTKALSVLTTLQVSLNNSDSANNTRFVLEQLDQLVQAKALHKESDIYTAQEQQAQIASTMERMYDETIEAWDATWCNPSNWRAQIKQ